MKKTLLSALILSAIAFPAQTEEYKMIFKGINFGTTSAQTAP